MRLRQGIGEPGVWGVRPPVTPNFRLDMSNTEILCASKIASMHDKILLSVFIPQIKNKRVKLPPRKPFRIHINEEAMEEIGEIMTRFGLEANHETLNQYFGRLDAKHGGNRYHGRPLSLIWARPVSTKKNGGGGYDGPRLISHSRGLELTLFSD